MNWIQKLADISQQPSRRIVGLMSGTSLDGLDIALCNVQGTGAQTKIHVEHSLTRRYDQVWRNRLQDVFAKQQVALQSLCLLNAELGTLHGVWVKEALAEWGIDAFSVDLVASHGQTVFHAPKHFHQLSNRPNATLQIGDGDHVAAACGIITVYDFRQRHVAHGGEGAPLVVYGDELLFTSTKQHRVLVNLGGICNFTFLYKNAQQPAFASDTGPANTLLDAYCSAYLGVPYDDGGEIAQQGSVSQPLLNELLAHSFFSQELPKTTGPEQFNLAYFESCKTRSDTQDLTPKDCLATLVAFSAQALKHALRRIDEINRVDAIYLSGGGVENNALVKAISDSMAPIPVRTIDDLGISAHDKEAVLFALLANECVAGTHHKAMNSKSLLSTLSMGKVCFPN